MDIEILKPGTTLKLFSEDALDYERTWTIGAFLGQGGSAVCYQAKCGNKTGRLKEFLPGLQKVDGGGGTYTSGRTKVNIKRDNEGQIYLDNESDTKKYIFMRDSFLSSYRILDRIRQDKDDYGIINNYVPPFLILFGKSRGITYGAYIWTPDDKQGETFDEYIREMIYSEEKEPEKRLYYILKVILGLADCLCVFHSVGLLHFDIKPSNFLVPYNRSKGIASGNISLFDINTLTTVGAERQGIKVTDGYSAPELYCEKGDNRSDIFSIGAVLYTALLSDEINGMTYFSEEKYGDIEKSVTNARLINSSEVNSGRFMIEMLVKILKGCLNHYPDNRYADCEALIKDLKIAMAYLLPAVESETLGHQKKLVLVDMEERINPVAVIQNLIYTNPLYVYLDEGKTLKILVLGCDSYARTFIDLSIQHGQLSGVRLIIKVLCKNARMVRLKYFAERPGLLDYIKKDGKRVSISFEEAGENEDRDKRIARQINNTAEKVNYCFISDGGDEYNRDTARLCSTLISDAGYKAVFAYRMENENLKPGKTGVPVYVSKDFEKAVKKRLKSMAYKVHCIWSGTDDDEQNKRMFRQRYNAESSLNFAISIKYKLYSLGIDEDDENLAAQRYADIILKDDNLARLASLEHRRWSMDLLTKGWSPPKENMLVDYLENSINRGTIKDKEHKLHHCLVPSTEETPLKGLLETKDGKDRWDKPGKYDAVLDPLDRVSVEVHRFFERKAEIISGYSFDNNPDIMRIRDILYMAGCEPSSVKKLEEFAEKITRVRNGNQKAVMSYGEFFWEIKDAFSKDRGLKNYLKLIEDRLRFIYRDVFVLAEAIMYRDFKEYDIMLVREIGNIMA